MSVSTDEPELVELVMPFFEAWRCGVVRPRSS